MNTQIRIEKVWVCRSTGYQWFVDAVRGHESINLQVTKTEDEAIRFADSVKAQIKGN